MPQSSLIDGTDPAQLQVAPRLELARALMQSGADTSPAYPMQAIARAIQPIAGHYIQQGATSELARLYAQQGGGMADALEKASPGHPLIAALRNPQTAGMALRQAGPAMMKLPEEAESKRRFEVESGLAREKFGEQKRQFGVEQQTKKDELKPVPFGTTMIDRTGKVVFQNNAGDQLLDDKTLEMMAEQYRAGDTTVMQNLGRGAQGAQNIVALRKKIGEQLLGVGASGTDQAMRNAEFFGVKAGQRTLGTKQANIEMAATEFQQVLPIVVAASNDVSRTHYPDLNRVIQMFETKTGDPAVVKFGGGINTLINLYSRAISPSGTPTVHDKEHAREILNKAWSQGQFDAAVGMMKQEIDAALKSPEIVRDEMRKRFGLQPQVKKDDTPAAPVAPVAPKAPTAGLPQGWGVEVR